MRELMPIAEKVGALLKVRKQTIVVAESSAGGLISASLLAVPGASAYFKGGGALYTRPSILALKDGRKELFTGIHGGMEAWALMLARTLRTSCPADWALGESGAAGPTGNSYGDPAGHAAIAVIGPVERTRIIETGNNDRIANMHAFAAAALTLLAEALEKG